MGLNTSFDEWCRQSDVITRGLPYTMKIVEDTIWSKLEEREQHGPEQMQGTQCNDLAIEIRTQEINTLCQTYHLRCPALVAQGVSTRRTGYILEALIPQGEL